MALRKVEKVAAWLGRPSPEFANALKSTLLPELQEHTKILSRHSAQLEQHEQTLQGGVTILRDSAILRDHSERLARLEARTEGLERSVDQGFRLLSDRMDQSFRLLSERIGDLSDRVGDLALQVRDNLQLRGRVTKMEARVGLTPDS